MLVLTAAKCTQEERQATPSVQRYSQGAGKEISGVDQSDTSWASYNHSAQNNGGIGCLLWHRTILARR